MVNWPRVSIDTNREFSHCFGCGRDNPIGLKLHFRMEDKQARTEFTPNQLHQGWKGFVHGGILGCMLDEAMSYAALLQGIECITAEMKIRLRQPVPIDQPLTITASITKRERKLLKTEASILLKDGTLVAESTGTLFVLNNEKRKPKAIPEARAEAVIWDMDGVIADTAPYHLRAWQKAFRKKGVDYTREDFQHSFGQRNDNIIRNALGEQTPESEIETIAREKEAIFRKLAKQNIKPLPGAIELIKSLKKHGVKMAIASSAPIENIRLILQSLGIANCFHAIVSGQDVTEGKPSPQVFRLAAKRLGVKPENCVVIEDAVAGVMAAKRAGMRCIAVTNTHPGNSLAEADLIVDTLEEVTADNLDELN